MTDTEIAVTLIKGFEGFSSVPYLCTGNKWTIGYGSTIDIKGNPITANTPNITEVEATTLLTRDILNASNEVARNVTVYIGANQRAALTSFVYNLGAHAFKTSTLLKKLNNRNYHGASEEFGKWVYSGGKVTKGLVTRRAKERDFFVKDML